MRSKISFLFLLLTILSCRSQQNEPIATTNEVIIPDDFPDFFEKFHTDSLFQIEHIVFPLAQQTDSTKWQKEDWVMHRPFDNNYGEFKREFDNFENIIIETTTDVSYGVFRTERRFSKFNNEWNLIYYTVKGWE